MQTSSWSKCLTLGAFVLLLLVPARGSADPASVNATTAWCASKSGALTQGSVVVAGIPGGFSGSGLLSSSGNRTIASSEASTLIWQTDGNLVLKPTNGLAGQIWSSGTAGSGDRLCYRANGSLEILSSFGSVLWSRSGDTSFTSSSIEHRHSLWLSGCTLSTRTLLSYSSAGDTVELWSVPGTCPVTSPSAVSDDWCADSATEHTIVQNDWTELTWQTDGNLVLKARGIDAGTTVWSSGTAGTGKKLCFDNTGKLRIENASAATLWSLGTAGPTTTSYMLGLELCNLNIRSLASSSVLASKASACPQAEAPSGLSWFYNGSDITIVETEEARLVFTTAGNLELRSTDGDVYWSAGIGEGRTVSFQGDGNLVIYSATWGVLWASGTNGTAANRLLLDRCSFSLLNGGTSHFTRGTTSCTAGSIASGWSMVASGTTRLLQTEEAHLDWQGDGNLVLYTNSGAVLWSTHTFGAGNRLAFQGDGNIVIYSSSWAVLWASATGGIGTSTLKLGDNCMLTLSTTSTVYRTYRDSCATVNHTYENTQGNSTFGSGLRTSVTGQDTGNARLENTTAVEVTVFGSNEEVFSATAYQTEFDDGSHLDTGSITVTGESAATVGFLIEYTFVEQHKNFMVGVVPVEVAAGATGEVKLALSASGGTLTLTPSAGLYATVSAGVGGGSSSAGASAGIRGSLTLLEIALPISFKIYAGAPAGFELRGDLTITMLSGSLSLYAEAFVKLGLIKISADYSYTFFKWTGVQWTKPLFIKQGTFN